MSQTVERPASAPGDPGQIPRSGGGWAGAARAGLVLIRQREATVFVVVVLLIAYFGLIDVNGRSSFFTHIDLLNLSQIAAPIMIIAYGEVLLLICGEIDLSVGFVYAFAPYVMHFLTDYYHVPGLLAIILALVLVGGGTGLVNAFLTVTLRLPSFLVTVGTGFVLGGLLLTLGHDEQAAVPRDVLHIGNWLGSASNFSQIIWAAALLVFFHVLLRNTRWGLHTIAVGGNITGAREAGVSVAKIKYGNFMITSVLGAFVGMQIAFQSNVIDTFAGGAAYQPMLYAVAAAVIGGTAMLGGSGTIVGAFLGGAVLAVLIDGFSVIGVSANPQQIFFGGAILIAMIGNVQLARLRREGRMR